MRIKRPLKKASNPDIAVFLSAALTCRDDELPSLLLPIVGGWQWPKTDLQHWIEVLNRFDGILEVSLKDYDLSSMEHCQTNDFTPRTKQLLLAVLAFVKVLLENSTNRKVFNSFDRLNELLHTTDTEILLATLRLTLRPAQQYSQTNVGNPFPIAEQRLLDLAQAWGTSDYGLEMVHLAGDVIEIPAGLDEVEWQFYKKAAPGSSAPALADAEGKGKGRDVEAMHVEPEDSAVTAATISTPAPKPRANYTPGTHLSTPTVQISSPPTEGLTSIALGNIRGSSKATVDILIDLVETHQIPETDRLALLQKIRIIQSLGSAAGRRTLLVVRILAIAIFTLTTTETNAQSKLFLYEPELVAQLSELVHPDRVVPMEVQAAALYALDAIAKSKIKTQEVASALNASVSHGILMYVMRRTLADLSTDNPTSTHEFIDALFNILNHFQTSVHIGNMIVGAGIVPLLVDFVKIDRRDRLPVVSKAIAYLDSLMYGYSSAFTFFCTATGVTVFVDRIKNELEACAVAHPALPPSETAPVDSPTGSLSFEEVTILKALLRALQRLMQTAGTTEGLRNLVDTSLLGSVKLIIQNRAMFGSQVFALAVNITATFVHNEPTCLTVIQEAKVPDAFYDAIEASIPASLDVIVAIPNVIGALCLNGPGLAQFNVRQVLDHYFAIFSSDQHVKVLLERDNGNVIGAAFDELIRHHPSLKDKILKCCITVMQAIKVKGEAWMAPAEEEGYHLKPVPEQELVTDAQVNEMLVDSVAGSSQIPPPVPTAVAVDALAEVSIKPEEPKENIVLSCVDIMGRFLEGLFQNMSHSKDFAKLEPYDIILDLLALPAAPYLTPGTSAFASFIAPIRILSETKSTEVLTAVFLRVNRYLLETKAIWDAVALDSTTIPLAQLEASNFDAQDRLFRSLANLLTFSSLLSELITGLSYAHGKISVSVLQVLARPFQTEVLLELGKVLRFSVWETILLKLEIANKTALASAKVSAAGPSPSSQVGQEVAMSDGIKDTAVVAPLRAPVSAEIHNLKALSDLVASFGSYLTPLFQSVGKICLTRRGSDNVHRVASIQVSKTLAEMSIASLGWMDAADLERNVSFSNTMLKTVSSLMFDDRASSSSIQMPFLIEFEKAGGMESLLALYTKFGQVVGPALTQENLDTSTASPVLSLVVVGAFAGFKTALAILQKLSSHRHILESPQTVILVAREKDKSNPDFLEPVQLLVRLRAKILPAVALTWDAEWIRKTPPHLVRSIVGILVGILKAEGELSTDGPPPGAGAVPLNRFGLPGQFFFEQRGEAPALAPPAVFRADETSVAQLMEMGFPRSAARTALTRTRNNVAVATEYLLSHPDVVAVARAADAQAPEEQVDEAVAAVPAPADPAVPAPAPDAEAVVEEVAAVPAQDGDVAMQPVDATPPAPATVDTPAPAAIPTGPTLEQQRATIHTRTKQELDAARGQLKPTFLQRALMLAEDYSALVFDIKGALGLLGDESSLEELVANLESQSTKGASKVVEAYVAIRLRVIALLAADAVYRGALETNRERLMTVLCQYGQLYSVLSPSAEDRPEWLAPAMLVADSLFSLAEVPCLTELSDTASSLPSNATLCQGPSWTAERQIYFTVALHVLAQGISTREVFVSTLRLLLVLTRDHTFATTFVEGDGLQQLFSSFNKERPETAACRPYAVMIIRHAMESRAVLLPIMEREIEAAFSASDGAGSLGTTTFLRTVSGAASRDASAFLEATSTTCKLVDPDALANYYLALLHPPHHSTPAVVDATTPNAGISAGVIQDEMVVDKPTDSAVSKPGKVPVPQLATPPVETAVHFLMAEVIESTKLALVPTPIAVVNAASAATPSTTLTPALVAHDAAVPADPASAPAEPLLDDYFRSSFSMACLAELLGSYSVCKTSFLSFSLRKAKDSSVSAAPSAPTKLRSSFISYLLNDVIPSGTTGGLSDVDVKKRTHLSQWASLVISALCHDSDSPSTHKDASHELTTYRKFVLDTISRAFKDVAASVESTEIRYGRLTTLSNLCARLLNSKTYPGGTKVADDTAMQLAKLMLEKNFAITLTNALADVDLNFPDVNNLINAILRPLEQLTKVVTKVGKVKPSLALTSGTGNRDDDDDDDDDEEQDSEQSSIDEGDEMEQDTEEEEAPDLYRNSALGMYEGELEPGHLEDAYMTGDSEEDYDEDDEEMDDMDEGLAPSDVSDVSDDEDEDAMIFGDEMDDMTNDGDDSDDDDEDEDSENDDELLHSPGGSDDNDVSVEELDLDEDARVALMAELDGGEGADQEWRDVLNQLGEAAAGDPLNGAGDEESEGERAEAEFDHQGVALIRDEEDAETDEDEEDYSDQDQVFIEGELEFDEAALFDARPGGRYGWDAALTGVEGARRQRMGDILGLNDFATSRRGTMGNAAPHPLLVDAPSSSERDAMARRRSGTNAQGVPPYDAWVEAIEQTIGTGAIEQLQRLLSQAGMPRIESPDQLRLQRNPGPAGGLSVVLNPLPPAPPGRRPNALAAIADELPVDDPLSAPLTARQINDRINSITQFLPVLTSVRFQEESRILQGSVLSAERIARFTNHVINVLQGPARERVAKEEAAAELRRETLRLARVNADRASIDAAVTGNTTEPEAEPTNQPLADGGDAMAQILDMARALATATGFDLTPIAAPAPAPSGSTPPVYAAPSPRAESPIVEDEPAVAVDAADPSLEHADVEEEMPPVASTSGAEEAAPAERVMIEIHGEMVDITETGIDPTFLEALPDDMREEVLNQHFRESRSAAPVPAVPSSINSEFLEALPPDLRAEVLRQEAAEQRREQAASREAAAGEEEGAREGAAVRMPAEVDPATFLATLAPHLREAVLLEQDDEFLATLPAALVAEANQLRANAMEQERRNGRVDPSLQQARRNRTGALVPINLAPLAKKPPVHREAIQLLDKSGLATLVRLLFFPQPLKKHILPRILIRLCENSRTRSELINLLLTILQDGTRDVSAVDKSFSQMSLRASKSLNTKETPRKKVGLDVPGGALPQFPGESVPNLIAQRCLEALTYLVGANEQASLFFLTEQEIVVGINKRSAKKGKGKEKAVSSTTFPVIVLLGLLDRPALLKTQSMMDSLTQLLSLITKGLSVLQKKPADKLELAAPTSVAPASAPTPAPAASTAASTSMADVVDASNSGLVLPETTDKELSPADIFLLHPPMLPASVLRLVVNILDAGECSSRTFQQTLVLIQNLSYLPEVREIISEELKLRAQGLCNSLVPDLNELLQAISNTTDIRGITLAKFSPASSLQAKLLRLLKTIDWLHSPAKKSSSATPTPEEDAEIAAVPGEGKKLTDAEAKISLIFDSFTFAELWKQLGACLAGIELKPELLFVATVLLPLIESLMVVSKYVGASRRSARETLSPMSPMSPRSEVKPDTMESMFLAFTDDHRKILNTMVRNNPALMSGSFAILVHNPKVLEFDNKRSYFFSRLHDRGQRQRLHYPTLQVNVRRQYVFEDSFHNLQRRTGDEIKYGKLNVKFYDEEGVDAGGVTREWFSVLSRQMFNPGYALFQPQAADALTYQPNKSSSINPEHLSFFKFVGRIIGKALHDQRVLEAYFSRSVYKHMLGKPVDHRDLESIDPEYHKSLVWMLENDIDGVLDLTFSVERDDFGVVKIIDLIPDGRNIVVTNENKAEYVRLIAENRLSTEIKEQIAALLAGLYEIIPKDVLQIFSEKELELLISGLPEIDVDEWRANTDLHGFSSSDPVIGYFWRAVRSFTHEERAKLLQFVTGSSRVPLEGFAHLQGMHGVTKFCITSAGESLGLPTAHSCFNTIDISSRYTSYEELRKALVMSFTEGEGAFGFA